MIINRRRGPATADAAELQPGETLAGYRIEGLLGAGGMGAVYEATQLSLKRHVALKVIAPGVPVNDTLRGRFQREGELQAVIDHPHILPVYEAGDDKGRLFIAMRLVQGPTLKKLAIARSLDPAAALHLLGDIASALDAAHAAGLVHRDVKPQNILIAPGNHAYLADFGLSRGRSDNTLTRPGQLLGSLSYMAPEQARGEPAGAAADIYAFTCVLYECLVGLVPFPRETDHAVMHAHEWEDPPNPSEIRPELPPALDDVIARGMAKDPAARPVTACAVVSAARAAFGIAEPAADPTTVALPSGEESEDTLRRPAPALPPVAARRTPSRAIAAAAACALILGGVGGYFATRDTTDTGNKPARVTQVQDPHTPYVKRLNGVFAQLDSARTQTSSEVTAARTPSAQAAALTRIAAEYANARDAVATTVDPPADTTAANDRVRRALAVLASTYRHLGTAARHRDSAAYARNRARVDRAQGELTAALRGLQRAGFRLQ